MERRSIAEPPCKNNDKLEKVAESSTHQAAIEAAGQAGQGDLTVTMRPKGKPKKRRPKGTHTKIKWKPKEDRREHKRKAQKEAEKRPKGDQHTTEKET